MAILRQAVRPVNLTGHVDLADVEPGQIDSCLDSLVADGLARVVSADRGTYSL